MTSFCTLCGTTDPADLGEAIGVCLDAAACHQRQYRRLRDRAEAAEAQVRRLEIALTAADALIREVLEALCRRDGLTLESSVVPGEPARNYDLALRLGIGCVFGLKEGSGG